MLENSTDMLAATIIQGPMVDTDSGVFVEGTTSTQLQTRYMFGGQSNHVP